MTFSAITLCTEMTAYASCAMHRLEPTVQTLLVVGVPLADMLPDDVFLRGVRLEEAVPRAVKLPGDKAFSLPVTLPNEGDPAYAPARLYADQQQHAQICVLLR